MKRTLVVVAAALAAMLALGGCEKDPYAVSGRVIRADGTGIPDVSLGCNFQHGFLGITTDENGFWSVYGLEGLGRIVPKKKHWSFSPSEKQIAGELNAGTFVTFVGTCSLTGTLTVADSFEDIYQMGIDCSQKASLYYDGIEPAISPDGKTLLTSSKGSIYICSIDGDYKRDSVFRAKHPAWYPSGTYFAYITWDEFGKMSIARARYDGTNETVLCSVTQSEVDALTCYSGGVIFSAGGKVYRVLGGSPIEIAELSGTSYTSLSVSPDENYLMANSSDRLTIFEFATNAKCMFEFDRGIYDSCWSPDGSHIALAEADGLYVGDFSTDIGWSWLSNVTRFAGSGLCDFRYIDWH